MTDLSKDTAFLTRCEEIVQMDNVRRVVEDYFVTNAADALLKAAYRGAPPHAPNDQDLIKFLTQQTDEKISELYVQDLIDDVDLELLLQLRNELVLQTLEPS